MKRREYELLLLVTVFCIGIAATAEAFLRRDSTAFGTGVYLDSCGFGNTLAIIRDGVPGADETKIVDRETMRGRASVLPFSLGALADTLGAAPLLPDGQPGMGKPAWALGPAPAPGCASAAISRRSAAEFPRRSR